MIRVEYVVQCDACGSTYNWRQFDSKANALTIALGDGWSGSFRRLLCPKCVADDAQK